MDWKAPDSGRRSAPVPTLNGGSARRSAAQADGRRQRPAHRKVPGNGGAMKPVANRSPVRAKDNSPGQAKRRPGFDVHK